MQEHLEHIVFYREQADERTLHDALAAEPGAAGVFERWRALREGVRQRIDDVIPDHRLFALYAIRRNRGDEALTDQERALLEPSIAELDRIIARHPGLNAVANDIAGAASDFDALWEEWMEPESKPVRTREDRRALRRTPGRYLVRGIIAATVVVFVAMLTLLARRDFQTVTISTAAGETRSITLGEGSSIRLMPNSSFAFVPPDDASPIDGKAELAGDAFFQIAQGGRGLVVTTETATVTVVGTTFGVQSDEEGTQVVLAEGRLTISPRNEPSRSVSLEAGQMSSVLSGRTPTAPQVVDVAEQLSWTGLFVFSATPLREIAERLSDHYRADVAIDPELANERVTGTFSAQQPLHEILEVIASTLGATVRTTAGGGYSLIPA